MSRFYVGQRVRLIRPDNPCNFGITGTIAEIFPEELPAYVATVNCAIDWDNGRRDARFDEEDGYSSHTDQLEPILDQKHEACDEDFKRDLDRMLDKEEVR